MRFSASAAVVAGMALQVTATSWDLNASQYSTPQNSDNQCASSQQSGYDFNDLTPGSSVSTYGANTFQGFTCKSSSNSKRSMNKRFTGNCIAGSVSAGSGPSVGCSDEDKSGFSLGTLQISSDEDTDVECHYQMPGGSTCKQTVRCAASGSEVTNSQCGGATSVSFVQPATATKSCSLSIHSISFVCGSATSSVYSASTTAASGQSSTASSVGATITPAQGSSSASASSSVSSAVQSSSASSSAVVSSSASSPAVYSSSASSAT